MRNTLRLLPVLLVCGALVWAQGAGGLGGHQTEAQKIRDQMNTGPGFVQGDFMTDLQDNLVSEFGEMRGGQMMGTLQDQGLESADVLKLMNGNVTKSGLQDLLGASRGEVDRAKSALDETVGGKDRKMFFGIVIFVIVIDMDFDPTADFAQQVMGSKDEMSKEAFGKLCKGNVSTNTIEDAFGFGSKDDQKTMQQILNALMQSALLNHPMCKSLGMGDSSKFNAKDFPQPTEGMPGYGEAFQGGMAGGLPFDQQMPPMPFFGRNLEKMFGCGAEGGGEQPAPTEPPAGKDG